MVLLGQNVNSYGRTLAPDEDFPRLLREVAGVPGIERVRFVTSHPRDLTPELVDAMAAERAVCPQIHLPLQSGSDRVLTAMNRGYTVADYERKVALLRERIPGIAISSDFIVGFPGETESEFGETLGAVTGMAFDSAFSFAYSAREGTAAHLLADDVPPEVKLDRLWRLQEAIREVSGASMQALVGTRRSILVEGPSPRRSDWFTGRDETHRIVHFPGGPSLVGRIVPVTITECHPNCLHGILDRP